MLLKILCTNFVKCEVINEVVVSQFVWSCLKWAIKFCNKICREKHFNIPLGVSHSLLAEGFHLSCISNLFCDN